MSGNKYLSNVVWRMLESFGAQGVTFVVSIILARVLDPAAYGVVAIVAVFTSLCNIFVDSGFGMALIQKKDADDLDFSSVFYFNMVTCIVLYLALFFCAPLIASLYNLPELTNVIRVQGCVLVVSGVKSVQTAYVSRRMIFKKFFFATLGGTLGAAALGIYMAYQGYGVWALVAQSLFNNTVDTLILWVTVKWRPRKMFSFKRLKSLFGYGSKLLVSNLIYAGYNDLRQLIVGKYYSTSDLAFYNRGIKLPDFFNTVMVSGLGSVLFPAMSNAQDSKAKVRAMLKRAVMLHSYILTPFFVGLAACAEPFMRLVFTDKWLPAVPFVRIFCIMYVFECIGISNQNATKALGYSNKTLKIECIKTPLYLLILIVTIPLGVKAVALGVLFGVLIGEIICAWPSKKTLDYSVWQQFRDIFPHLALSAVMGMCVWLITLLNLSDAVTLLLQVVCGVSFYYIASLALKLESFFYMRNLLKAILGKFFRKKKDEPSLEEQE